MSIESQADLDGLSRAGKVVAHTLSAMEQAIAVGITTQELDDIARQSLESYGARPTPKDELGFPGYSCISINDEAVHGIPSARRIQADDIVKLDVTAHLAGYVADAARTVVVEPKTSDRLRLARASRSAFAKGIATAQVGKRTDDVGAAIESETKRNGFRVIRALCGHGVGRKMHEAPAVPNYREPKMSAPLTHGLVITIEPIICNGNGRAYEAKDGWTVKTSDGSAAAHFEETVLITRNGPRVLTR